MRFVSSLMKVAMSIVRGKGRSPCAQTLLHGLRSVARFLRAHDTAQFDPAGDRATKMGFARYGASGFPDAFYCPHQKDHELFAQMVFEFCNCAGRAIAKVGPAKMQNARRFPSELPSGAASGGFCWPAQFRKIREFCGPKRTPTRTTAKFTICAGWLVVAHSRTNSRWPCRAAHGNPVPQPAANSETRDPTSIARRWNRN